MDAKKLAAEVLKRLTKQYAGATQVVLHYSTPFELLAATILSAQTTDLQVNKVTQALFVKYPTIEAYADAPLEALTRDVASVNFFRNKAKNIKLAAQMVLRDFHGEVPRTMQELVLLPGVARKTANIVLSRAFGIHDGIAVDTHVKRLAARLGLTRHDDPVKVEQDLLAVTPKKSRGDISNLLIYHGRAVCMARNPDHGACVLREFCPSRES